MIMIFAGSGASKAVDSNRYPTTIDFFNKLPDSVTNNPIFDEICAHLKTALGNETPDIENILFILAELRVDLEKGRNNGTFFGWLITRNLLGSLSSPQFDTSVFPQMAATFISRIDQLIDEINVRVYSHYGTEPTEESLDKTWLNLLNSFRDTFPESPIDIFTTNYDLALESVPKYLNNKNFTFETGRRRPNILGHIDLTCWNGGTHSPSSSHSSKTNIMLTKLHGSVDWSHKDGSEIRSDTPGYMGDHSKHVILYPGFKGQPDTEPFVTFHNYFRSCLSKVKLIVFIGFAFRDDHINDLLIRNTPAEVEVRIIDMQDNLEHMPLQNNPVKYIPIGFSPKGIKEFFSSLPPTKE